MQPNRIAFVALFALAVLMIAAQASPQQKPAESKAATQPPKSPREPGLYMTFETALGAIHCRLYENEAPVTVRTVVGLALGTKSYIDPRTKQTVGGKRFFDGLTFHRVVPRFMIQGGDPLGNGTGGPEGPGFPFKDEFAPALQFDVPGRLAMANAGPGTNGSQFFITDVPAPHLNNRHTIFGQCEDLDVVKAIARVPARDETAINPVVIKRVNIERVGSKPANAPEDPPDAKSVAKGTKKQ